MTYYKKVGRKYVPVMEELLYDAFSAGAYLVIVKPGSRSLRTILDPQVADLVAAAEPAKDAMAKAIVEASKFRPTVTPITKRQRDAWIAFDRAMGKTHHAISIESAHGIAEAGIRALIAEAAKR